MGAFLDRLQSPPPQPAPPPPPLRAAPPSPSHSMSPLQLPSPVVPAVPAATRKEDADSDRLQRLRAGSKKRTRAYNPEAMAVAVPKRRRESV